MKKTLFLVLLLIGSFFLVSCTNVQRDQGYTVLDVEDIIDKNIVISIKVRSGVVKTAVDDLVPKFYTYLENKYGKKFITVEVKSVTGSYDDLRSTTVYDINAKNKENIPDIIMGYPDHFAEYYSGGNLVNLQGFIEDKKVGFTKEELADFIQSYLPENRGFDVDENGLPTDDLYGLPFNKSTEVLVYNKTAMQALFGDNYLNKIPTTWAEVEQVGKEILELVKQGKLDNVFEESVDDKGNVTYLKVSKYLDNKTFYPISYDSSDNGFITLIRQFGAEYTRRNNIFEGYVAFDNKQAKDAMKYFQKLRQDGIFGTAAVLGQDYNSNAMKLIQVLMSIGSSAGVGYNTADKYQYELGVAPIPYYDENYKYVIQQGTNIAMLNWNTDEEKLAAWLFMKFLMEPEITAEFAMATGGYLPVRTSAYNSPAYKEYLTNPTLDKKPHSQAANVALHSYIEKNYIFFVDPAFVGSSAIRKEAGKVFDSIIVNLEDVETRFKQAYNSLAPYVQKNS